MAGRNDIEAGRAHIMLYVKNSALVKGLNAVRDRLQGLGTSILKVGGFLSGLGAAIVGPLSAAVSHFVAAGSALEDISSRTGISREALGELKFAAEQSGASLDDVEKATKKLAKTIVDADRGTKTAKQSLDLLGLSSSDLAGKLPDEQLQIVADRLAAIEDPTMRAVAAQELLGKSGTKLLPMVASLRDLREEARRLGIAPTEEASKLADALGDAFDAVRSVAGATIFEIGSALAPALLPAAEALKEILGTVNRWVRANAGLVRTVALVGVGLLAAGAVVTALGATIFGVGTAFGLVASALVAIAGGAGVVLSPISLLITMALGGAAAWVRFSASGQAAFRALRDVAAPVLATLRTALGGIGDALAAGDLALAGQIAIKGLQVVFLQGVAALAEALGGTLGDAASTIGTQVLQGDLAGAWRTVVQGMATLWADFAEGMVAVFTLAARAVTDVWQKTVSGISDSLLDASAQGGVMGKIASSILGVDMQAEQERANRLNAQLGLGPQDITEQAKADVRAQVASTAEASRKFLDDLDRSFREQSDAAREDFTGSVAGGGERARSEASRLAAELEELRKAAAQAREAAAARSAAGAAPDLAGLGGPEALKQSAIGTFSAAGAAALAFGGGGPTARIVRASEKTVEKLDLLHRDLITLRDKLVVPAAG